MKIADINPSGLTGCRAYDEAAVEAASLVENDPFIKKYAANPTVENGGYLARSAWMMGYIAAKLKTGEQEGMKREEIKR